MFRLRRGGNFRQKARGGRPWTYFSLDILEEMKFKILVFYLQKSKNYFGGKKSKKENL